MSNCVMKVSICFIAADRSSRLCCARETISRSSSASSLVMMKLVCFCWSSEKRWNSRSDRSLAIKVWVARGRKGILEVWEGATFYRIGVGGMPFGVWGFVLVFAFCLRGAGGLVCLCFRWHPRFAFVLQVLPLCGAMLST